MKQSDRLVAKTENLAGTLDLLSQQVAAQGRDLSAVEKAQWDAGLDKMKSLNTDWRNQVLLEANVQARMMNGMTTDGDSSSTPTFDRSGGMAFSGEPGRNIRVINPQLKAFRNPRDARDSGLWLRAFLTRDGASVERLASRRGDWVASLNENNPPDGGYLVPAPLANAIIAEWGESGAIIKLARRWPMSSDTEAIPMLNSGTSVYYPGEEGEITPSDLDLGRVNLIAKKRAILSYISNELRDDAMIAIVDFLAQDMGQQFAIKQDAEGVAGDGTSAYGGVLGVRPAVIAATASVATAATGHDTWPELDYGDFAALMAKIPAKHRTANQMSFLCSSSFKWAVMDRLALAHGGTPAGAVIDGLPQGFFLGYPVVVSDQMPTATATATVGCLFGNFPRALALGERGQMRVATSEHIGFTSDKYAVRATVRYDINVHGAGDTSTVGAIAGLATAAS